ncbi:hypothetical protein VNO77_32076 [Canavalia gladiata]|uniref:TF-B3 domain-containing protein n=1 Tax=Canavalia gladiata TaxID=3824 RepID=A0AAN9KRK6_CANGL
MTTRQRQQIFENHITPRLLLLPLLIIDLKVARFHIFTASVVSEMAKGCTNNNYEEARKQRLEENKKRFEDLGISKISKNLTEITSSAKKTLHHLPKLKPKTNGVVEPRRSTRVRNPAPSYCGDVSIDLPPLRKRSRSNSSSWGSYIARPLDEIKEATEEERICALEAAEALQNNLKSSNPSFIKSMLRSHVYSCFWLGLPSKFCEEHLPKTLYDMILEDENGLEYEAVYIGKRCGLSGGWRAFALDHKLDDGDALVFELIEAARFKIYTVRAFPHLIEEQGKDVLEEEGKKRATKATKAASNRESGFNKTKKPPKKNGFVEDADSKLEKVEPIEETSKCVSRKPRKKPAPKDVLEEEGNKSATKATKAASNRESGSNKTKTPRKKNRFVEDADSKLEKVEPVEETSKCVSRKPRKKPAPKFFCKRA